MGCELSGLHIEWLSGARVDSPFLHLPQPHSHAALPDNTTELLHELEKIKHAQAAEQAYLGQVEAEATEAEWEAQIATANPLLNLSVTLGNTPGINITAPGTFVVKQHWDDGL